MTQSHMLYYIQHVPTMYSTIVYVGTLFYYSTFKYLKCIHNDRIYSLKFRNVDLSDCLLNVQVSIS